MNLNKLILLTSTLFLLNCSSTENLSKKFFSNPADGVTIYDEDIDVGLKAIGGKISGRHLEQAKKHCSTYKKKAIYVTSGAIKQGLVSNKYRTYEIYVCDKSWSGSIITPRSISLNNT